MRKHCFRMALVLVIGAPLAYLVQWLRPPGKVRLPVEIELPYEFKWGFVDETGRLVIEPEFEIMPDESVWDQEGMFLIGRTRKFTDVDLWGWINREGQEVIPIRFEDARKFTSEGVAPVRSGELWGLINRSGETVGPFLGNKPYNRVGTERVPVCDWKTNKWGFVGFDGELVIPHRWDFVGEFDPQGMAPVWNGELWGWIDSVGEYVIPPKWVEAYPFDDHGMALVANESKWTWIGRDGKQVIANSYSAVNLEHFESPFFTIIVIPGLTVPLEYGLEVLEFEAKLRAFDQSDDLAAVEESASGDWVFINRKGEVAVPFRGTEVLSFGQGGLAPALDIHSSKWGWIDRNGDWVLQPRWEFASRFDRNGNALVSGEERKIGLVNSEGNIIVEPNWLNLDQVQEGFYNLTKLEEPGYFEKALNWMGLGKKSAWEKGQISAWIDGKGKVIWSNSWYSYGAKCTFVFVIGVVLGIITRPRQSRKPGRIAPGNPDGD